MSEGSEMDGPKSERETREREKRLGKPTPPVVRLEEG